MSDTKKPRECYCTGACKQPPFTCPSTEGIPWIDVYEFKKFDKDIQDIKFHPSVGQHADFRQTQILGKWAAYDPGDASLNGDFTYFWSVKP